MSEYDSWLQSDTDWDQFHGLTLESANAKIDQLEEQVTRQEAIIDELETELEQMREQMYRYRDRAQELQRRVREWRKTA